MARRVTTLNMRWGGGRAETAPTLDSLVQSWYEGDRQDPRRVRFDSKVMFRPVPAIGRGRRTPPRGGVKSDGVERVFREHLGAEPEVIDESTDDDINSCGPCTCDGKGLLQGGTWADAEDDIVCVSCARAWSQGRKSRGSSMTSGTSGSSTTSAARLTGPRAPTTSPAVNFQADSDGNSGNAYTSNTNNFECIQGHVQEARSGGSRQVRGTSHRMISRSRDAASLALASGDNFSRRSNVQVAVGLGHLEGSRIPTHRPYGGRPNSSLSSCMCHCLDVATFPAYRQRRRSVDSRRSGSVVDGSGTSVHTRRRMCSEAVHTRCIGSSRL